MTKAIDDRYKANPWVGKPIGPEKVCADGDGIFREYENHASIYYTPDTGAHIIFGHIRDKWIALGRETGPNGYPTSDEIDAGKGPWTGRQSIFQQGRILWKQDAPEAYSVYGAIDTKYGFWGYEKGKLGFPVTDERDTRDNSGRYNEFDRGAIYYRHSTGAHVIMSPILDAWTLADRELGLFGFPASDTPELPDITNAYVQAFPGGGISCASGLYPPHSLVTGGAVSCRIEPMTRAGVLIDSASAANTRVLPLMRLNRYVVLDTACVIFRKSYTRELNDSDVNQLKSSYMEAVVKFREFNYGLARINPKVVVIDSELTKEANFKDIDDTDPAKDQDKDTFQAGLVFDSALRDTLQNAGVNIGVLDFVTINIPWVSSTTDLNPDFAHANPKFMFDGNTKTWSTVHYIKPGDYWFAFYVHEMSHCLDWILNEHGYPELKGPPEEEHWWAASYPHLTAATFTPKFAPAPENLKDTGEYGLYAMHQRIKKAWFNLPPKWGRLKADTTSLQSYGEILTYTCPGTRTIIEDAWDTKYFPNAKVSKYFQRAYEFGVALGFASYQLSVSQEFPASLELAKDALQQAQSAGQALKPVVLSLDLGPLKKLAHRLDVPYDHVALAAELAALRDGEYSRTIRESFLDGLDSAYLLGANIALAEGQVSRDPNNVGGLETVEARTFAIKGLQSAKEYVTALGQRTPIHLDATKVQTLLDLFAASKLNKVIRPRISTERQAYKVAIGAAPY